MVRELATLDGWENLATNMGVLGSSKSESTIFRPRRHMDHGQIDAMYRQDGMSGKLVDEIVEDAFRCGWRVVFGGDSKVDAEAVNDINHKLDKWHRATRFISISEDHFKQSRWAGASLLVLGVKDGQEPEIELDSGRVREFTWVQALDRFQVSPSGQLEGRPTSRYFGMPIWYDLMSIVTSSGSTTFGQGQTATPVSLASVSADTGDMSSLNNVKVHTSRVWRSDGVSVSDRARFHNGGWGDSVLERARVPLRAWSSAMLGAEDTLVDYNQAVYKIRGLKEMLSSNREDLVTKRFRLMDRVRSIFNAVLVDAEGNEDFERKSTNATGMPELIDRVAQWLSAVSGMPLTKLFGVGSGGFSKGEGEGENWDDKVTAWQTKNIKPMLEYVYGLLFATPEFSGVPEGWTIEFESLQLESPAQTAETRLKNSQADAAYMDRGALAPLEVKRSRFGGAKYGNEIDIDEKATAAMGELGGEVLPDDLATAAELNAQAGEGAGPSDAGEDVQKKALNGAQTSSLTELMGMVSAGDMPAAAAQAAAQFVFPTMSPEQAAGIFGPLETFAASKPKPEPPPQFGLPKPEPDATANIADIANAADE